MSWLYLNHPLAEDTPLYGGVGEVRIDRVRSMGSGHTSNNSELAFPAHAGTHIDAPRHFDASGQTLDDFAAGFWHCVRPWLVDCPASAGEIIDLQNLEEQLSAIPADCDLLLLRTGFERWRRADPEVYAMRGPGLAPEVGAWLRHNRRLKMLGFDFISVSSFAHRETGRAAHRALLVVGAGAAEPVLPIEDMALGALMTAPTEAWIMPLFYRSADGAPVTVVAKV